jgi:hypothetical protein
MPKNILTLVLLLVTAGCASTVQKSGQSAPTPVGAEAGKSCTLEAAAVGAAFSMQEGEPKPTGDFGTLVVVDVADYRYVSTGARIMLGVMTGNAYINAQVAFRDLKSGDVRSNKTYDTTSTAWQGIFSGMTVKQVRAMCHEIVGEIAQ